jgi:hypothetical protein
MCVNTKNYAWERPARVEDCAIISEHFSNIDFQGLLTAMSQDNAYPLTSDLVLVGAMMHTPADDLGMRPVPFTCINLKTREVVKLPVMEQIVDWFENTALGSDMWQHASDWTEKKNGTRVHFAMNCSCGLVETAAYHDGRWQAWKVRFNQSRSDLYGRTRIGDWPTNSIEGLDITPQQFEMWQRIRNCLEALSA